MEQSLEAEGATGGSWLASELVVLKRYGGHELSMREEGYAEGEAPGQAETWYWLWDEISSQTLWWRKPSRG
jgi:hypothetical protein